MLEPLRVLAVTVNPYRLPQPYNPKVFFGAVADAVGDRAPVFDVVNEPRIGDRRDGRRPTRPPAALDAAATTTP